MTTLENPNELQERPPIGARLHPGHLTAVAFGIGFLAFVLSRGQDPCSSYAGKSILNGLVVGALAVQGASLVWAVVRCFQRVPGAAGGLAGSIVASVLAVPAALVAAIAINGFLCGF